MSAVLDKTIKKFIEDNYKLLNANMLDEFYEQAYIHLPERQIYNLSKLLTKVLGIDGFHYARENAMKHFAEEFENYIKDEGNTVITIAHFVNVYMNGTNGLDFDEFQELVGEFLANDKRVTVSFDGMQGYITKRKTR